MTVTPTRTREQRLRALAHANEIRHARRIAKLIFRRDAIALYGVIAQPPPELETMLLREALLSLEGVGPARVDRFLTAAQISSRRALGTLTPRQREAPLGFITARRNP